MHRCISGGDRFRARHSPLQLTIGRQGLRPDQRITWRAAVGIAADFEFSEERRKLLKTKRSVP